ncbi:MAG: ABC transporter ATP-binding protein [Propionibacteriaceae bacterium]|jgi:ABC-2 type transport system ATP-binding protein|nr:ABC transporter ATP-binding protein [Propionibacteriaceae bacterium]
MGQRSGETPAAQRRDGGTAGDGPPTDGAIIVVDRLTKDYGHGRGIFGVSFQVAPGEVFGFVGPNGAGKTTTIRQLMGFSAPQAGRATILGLDCWRRPSQILRRVGYLPGEIALPDGLTGSQFIRFMQGLRGARDSERLRDLLDLFQLDPRSQTKRMSLGDKRKLAVVTAFMADPDVLLLDEPTSGLDPIMQDCFIEFMRREKDRGKTILLSSHLFSEVEAVCDRVAIIKDGEIVSTVRTDDIRHNESKTYQIKFGTLADFQAFLTDCGPQVAFADQDERRVEVRIDDDDVNHLVRRLALYQVIGFKERKTTLEDYFLRFYESASQKGSHGPHH